MEEKTKKQELQEDIVKDTAIDNTVAQTAESDASTTAKTPQDKKKELWRVIKFVLFSASAGIIQTVLFTILNEVAHLDYWLAYLPALVASVIWNFTFNRKFTFQAANNVPLAMLLVAIYYAIFTPLSTLWGNALEKVGWNEYAILALTMFVNLTTEFLYQKYVVFRNAIDTNDRAKEEEKKADSPAETDSQE